MSEVTRILSAIEQGDPRAPEQLLPLVYDELRRLAAAKMSREPADHTLQATALVHEAYLRLVDTGPQSHWNGRAHFFGAAAEAMRRILVEQARHRRSLKAGEALDRLAEKDSRKAELVKLRFFAGLSHAEAADALGISTSTADDDWAYARSWLRVELSGPKS
jgi:DNA-directed RNA polymerase specialized sigma24 family protein